MLRRRTVCVLEVAARADGPRRLATEAGNRATSAVRQVQESGLIGRLWPIGDGQPVLDFSWLTAVRPVLTRS
jgi:hypothetical protein